jgi:hypothetical protein
MSALAQEIHAAEFEQVTLATPKPVRPALQVVAGPVAAPRRRFTFRWRMDPVERRLVQVWELCEDANAGADGPKIMK